MDLVVEAEAEPEFTDERYCDAIIGGSSHRR
jgi:hypothetical protein